MTEDEGLRHRALEELGRGAVAPGERITAEVARGRVTLRGEVDSYDRKTAAESAIRELSGVCGVTNLITLRTGAKAVDVRGRIEEAFRCHAGLEARQVNVGASDGRVVLTGRVDSWHEKELAVNAARHAPGVTSVEDRIAVAS